MTQTYIVLGNWTDQGIRNIKETLTREDAVREMSERVGCRVKEVYRTMGRHDWMFVVEAPDDATMTAFLLALGSGGNSRSETLRAFTRSEVEAIVARIP